MAILTAAQIARFCADAGWAGEEIVIAVAVCLAESSGNTEAYNPEPDFDGGMESHAYGLWQIECRDFESEGAAE
jgi:hypothetical protein